MIVPPKKSKRTTSKFWLAVNTTLGWIAIFYGIWTLQATTVVAPMIGLILHYSAYVLVGHLDFKRILEAQTNNAHPFQ